jgi:hypothetical protein
MAKTETGETLASQQIGVTHSRDKPVVLTIPLVVTPSNIHIELTGSTDDVACYIVYSSIDASP